MRHEYVTGGIVRCPDRMAEVSRGRSSRASGEGPKWNLLQHHQGHVTLGCAVGFPCHRIHNQSVPVLRQQVPAMAQL